uniref:Thiamine transporter 2 n=1 Tax=Panagrellus redivivus TaxID=6233 RepID=A0A7E4ZX56_PANRE
MHWKLTAALVCFYGVVKEFRPATPFLTPFLESDYKNLTNEQLYSEVFPIWTYSYLIFLIPVFFLTDTLRYKPVVILEALSLVGTWSLLVWGSGVNQMKLMQVFFGLASSAEIAYYSYMYAVVDKKHYRKITSYTRTANLIGKFFAFGMAQTLVSMTGSSSYLLLNQISLGAVSMVLLVAMVLPPISKQMLQPDVVDSEVELQRESQPITSPQDGEEVQKKKVDQSYWAGMKEKALIFKNNKTVLSWSLWWALASCGIYQMANYAQTLWAELQTEGQFVGNGVVECINTLLGAIVTFYLQYFKLEYKNYGAAIFFFSSVIIGTFLIAMTFLRSIIAVYVLYIIVDGVYHVLIAAASNIIASQLSSASYSFIFGCNTFCALIFQSILTFAVADARGFALDIRTQFRVYGAYFYAIAVLFAIPTVYSRLRRQPQPSQPETSATE